MDTDATGTTHKARASNGVSVGAVNGLSGQLKTMIQSFVPGRRTYMVRAAFVKGRPALHDDTDGLSELAKMANSLLRRECYVVAKKEFRWNTIHVIPVDGVKSIMETSYTGLTVSAIVSGDGSGAVSAKGATQPAVFEAADKEILVCDGGKNGTCLVRFANDRAVQPLGEFDTHALGEFGL